MRALIVDDERLARQQMRALLAAHPCVEIAGEADSSAAALRAVEAIQPDVVFLDIQMPGGSGFDLLARATRPFRTVFVTAFDDYAVRAFEANALDYLLKPVTPERLAQSLRRLLAPPSQPFARRLAPDDYVFLAQERTARFARVSSIVCITGAGPYSHVVSDDGTKEMIHRSLVEWDGCLPEHSFRRVHRSAIVNLDHVARTETLPGGGYRLHLRHGAGAVRVSRRYAVALRRRDR